MLCSQEELKVLTIKLDGQPKTVVVTRGPEQASCSAPKPAKEDTMADENDHVEDARARARRAAPKAVEELYAIMCDRHSSDATKLQAATTLLKIAGLPPDGSVASSG